MFASITGFAGTQPFNDWFTPDIVQRHVLGTTVTAVDAFWGLGKFMYVKSADALLKGSLTMWDESYNGALLPSTALLGFPFGVAMAPMAAGTFGWVQLEGRAVYKTSATVAADAPVAIAAAGIVGALAAGKQLLNVRNRVAATGTRSVAAGTSNGSNVITTGGYDGFFLGMALSGAGIPATTVVAGLDPDGKRILTGSAIGVFGDRNATATGGITLTGTYTGYGSALINNPFAQGAIT